MKLFPFFHKTLQFALILASLIQKFFNVHFQSVKINLPLRKAQSRARVEENC